MGRRIYVATILAAIANTSLAASFDCSKAASYSEIAICNDHELSKLDDELSVIYKKAKTEAIDQEGFRQQTQAEWRWREANCKDRECLLKWYAKRKQDLQLSPGKSMDEEGCLKDGESVTFTGMLSRETFPGRPNFTSIEDGDEAETVWILNSEIARCVEANSIEDGSKYEVTSAARKYQLTFEDPSAERLQRSLAEGPASVSGQLFVGLGGHHHTDALISVKDVAVSKQNWMQAVGYTALWALAWIGFSAFGLKMRLSKVTSVGGGLLLSVGMAAALFSYRHTSAIDGSSEGGSHEARTLDESDSMSVAEEELTKEKKEKLAADEVCRELEKKYRTYLRSADELWSLDSRTTRMQGFDFDAQGDSAQRMAKRVDQEIGQKCIRDKDGRAVESK